MEKVVEGDYSKYDKYNQINYKSTSEAIEIHSILLSNGIGIAAISNLMNRNITLIFDFFPMMIFW